MKTTALVASLLASVALAQPHGHGHHHRRNAHARHEKRDVVTTWVTEIVYETVTEIVDDSTTELLMPSTAPASKTSTTSTTASASPGQFFEGPQTTSSVSPATTSQPPPKVVAPPPPPPPPPVVLPPPPPPPPAPAPPPAPSSSSSSAPPAQTGGNSGGISVGISGGSASYAGDLTHFTLGLGACGFDDSGKDTTHYIVALSAKLMGPLSNSNPMCGKTITIKGPNGKTLQALVHDKCPECAVGDVDGSEKLFQDLFGSLDYGREKIEWSFT